LELEEGGDAVRFCVSDTGHGIAPEMAGQLFNPFSLGDSSYARKEQGAGLGLAVAKRVVEKAGGTIGFASKPGEGAQFFFTLPISGAAPAMLPREQESPQTAPTGLSLLVFLRTPGLTAGLARLLEPFGNRLYKAETMAEAVEHAGRDHFDAIIAGATDADMLAAAPGVKAPLVALMLRGDRAPSATDIVLRWPVETDQLYRALHEIHPEGEEGVPSDLPAAIDAEAFSTLEKSVGVKTLVEILQCYVVTAEQLTEALAEACAQEKWDEAARLAQDIVGAAGGLGLTAITQAARRFAQAARDGQNRHDLRNAAQLVVGEHVRARDALIHLYPEVA
jgi:HPt (histidine-containing phosphotransfer) domain-containing protein